MKSIERLSGWFSHIRNGAALCVAAGLLLPWAAGADCFQNCHTGRWSGTQCTWSSYYCYGVENVDRCGWAGTYSIFRCSWTDRYGIIRTETQYTDTCYHIDGC
jgi:hypothetical protein